MQYKISLEVTKDYPNINVTLTNKQVVALIECAIKKKFSELEEMIAGKNAIHNDAPAKTADFFEIQIDASWCWDRDYYLKSIGRKKECRSCDTDKISNW